jgi:NADPH:quinone reductase-like Zn-dependent oxidoreductase
MKAIVCTKWGPPDYFELREVAKPVPGDKEVLIKIFATTANAADTRMRMAKFPALFWLPMRLMLGFRRPRNIMGLEFAGVIESVGKNVKRFKTGDPVFGSSGTRMGAYAEYNCQPEKAIMTIKPPNISFEEAAGVPHCGLTALHYLKKADIRSGQKVLIFGASGGIGSFAVQLSKYFGADVTGVCSTPKMGMVKSLGADKVVDYTKEDFSNSGETYDVIFDTIGKSSMSGCIKSLKKGGSYLQAVNIEIPRILGSLWMRVTSGRKVKGGVALFTRENLNFLNELLEAGKIKSFIDRIYPLEQMAEAHRYVDGGYKKGNVAITVRKDERNRKTEGNS